MLWGAVYRKISLLTGPVLLLVAVAGGHLWMNRAGVEQGPVARIFFYAAFAAVVVLGLVFRRNRPVIAGVFIALIYFVLFESSALVDLSGEYRSGFLFVAFPVLPLNLALMAFLPQRPVFSRMSLFWVCLLILEVGGLLGIVHYFQEFSLQLQEWKIPLEFVPPDFPVSHAVLIASVLGSLILGGRLLVYSSPLDAGLLAALVAALAAAFQVDRPEMVTWYLGGAQLALAGSLVAISHSLAFRDQLTGLPARRALDESLATLGGRYSIAMVDIDHFKKFNDTYGHETGDQALKMVAGRLAGVTGGGRAFRYGGEEFSILFSGKTAEEAEPYIEKIREGIEKSPFVLRSSSRPAKKPKNSSRKFSPAKRGKRIPLTVSIGVADKAEERATAHEVLKAADEALYKAKRAGRNCVRLARKKR
jgi:diguanylate cyclase (GGDEF)-like protein